MNVEAFSGADRPVAVSRRHQSIEELYVYFAPVGGGLPSVP